MAQDSKIKEFPDIGSKLQAPTKKSLFERQKAEAEAKRQREQDETAAVYEDFVKSFDDEGGSSDPTASRGSGFGSSTIGGGLGGPPKRHFSGAPPGPAGRGGGRGNSGPGSLGPPPPSFSRKRQFDGPQAPPKEQSQGLFAFEDAGPMDTKTAFQTSDDEESAERAKSNERAAPKPTLRLSSLPPGTSQAFIKSILPSTLSIDVIRITPPSAPVSSTSTERRSLSAVVTLAKETPATDIDTAVSALQNRYLGRGYYLSLSRHLSSAAIGMDMPSLSSTSSSLPFGARPIPAGPMSAMGRGAPGPHRGGYAPPSSYLSSGSGQYGRNDTPLQVNVVPPSDLKQLKVIHKTIEALLTHGPEFEALLMNRRDVQMEEKWAWLWDARSTGGVYYRWRIWDILTGASRRDDGGNRAYVSSQRIFEGGPVWSAPEKGLPFEFATHIEEIASDSDYNSSDDDGDSGDEGRRRHAYFNGGALPPDSAIDGDAQQYLNPLWKAKLTHLLARLPTTNAKLRRGDVARVTAFAIQRAGEGAEEVVQMITSNVLKPFAFSSANPERKLAGGEEAIPGDNDEGDDERRMEKEDTSSAMLIGLYVISDILSSSSTSGVRHAWRYRQLFEAALKRREVFATLGRLEKPMHWGRLKAEKWKRSVGSVLTLWEGWCVFPQASQEHFSSVFFNPPLTAAEVEASLAAEKAEKASTVKSRWKTVDENTRSNHSQQDDDQPQQSRMTSEIEMDIDGEPMSEDENDLDGEPMVEEDEDVDGKAILDEDNIADGEPVEEMLGLEEGARRRPSDTKLDAPQKDKSTIGFQMGRNVDSVKSKPPLISKGRKRPKAEDMFADSDEE